ncbi:polar amino acid transport system substrate-binding protein [Motilibacter peucedani]|uniref:Polar amino acid transport system substrate-binding protein n=1 Tax=Motilibacter peucedani TaxID=598650 RepID=A0A420XNI9_9ACTN|nr:ABC transporter substrate-binding protein [Motilibacter peucedani]RKS73771.1 polar amino acid transport system substrate-binding protein [Motilibacter peucedani]
MRTPLRALPLALTVTGLALAGCGGSSSPSTDAGAAPAASAPSSAAASAPAAGGSDAPAASADASGGTGAAADPASEVPAEVKSKGKLTVAADASYAPNEFFQPGSKTVVGMDADLAKAIGAKLGLQVEVVNQTFDSIIPGIQAGRYDMGMSSFTDTKKREAVVDFVTYFNAGTSFFTKAGAKPVTTLDELCGLNVAVEKGTTQADDATAQSKKCTDGGKKAVKVDQYPDQGAANVALSSGRDAVSMADSPVAAYQVKRSKGAFVLSGDPYGEAPYGIALPKGNGMAKAVQDALKALIADGSYAKVLETWGTQNGAITDPVINGATS